MPQTFTLADGSKVEYPDGPLTKEEQVWLRSAGGLAQQHAGSDMVKSGVSGVVEGAVRAPFIGGDLYGLGANLLEKLRPGSTSEQARKSQSDEVLGALSDATGMTLHTPETQGGRYASAAGNAVGGSILGGVTSFKPAANLGRGAGLAAAIKSLFARTAQTPVVQNSAVGLGGELAGDMSRGFDETKDQNPLARFGGSAATALAAALGARSLSPRFAKPLYESTKGMNPQEWEQAWKETQRLQRAGAQTNTVADALPPSSPVRAITEEISNATGGQPLYDKLAGRTAAGGEIPRLLDEAKTTAQQAAVPQLSGPVSSINPMQTGDEAVAAIARRNRTGAMLPILENAPLVPRQTIAEIVRDLRSGARQPNNRGTEDARALYGAARTVAGTPRYPMPGWQPPQPPGPLSGPSPITGPGPMTPPPAGVPVAPPALPGPSGMNPPQLGMMSRALVPQQPGGTLDPLRTIPDHGPSRFQMPSTPDITDVSFPVPQAPTGANLEALSKIVKSLDMVNSQPTGVAGQVLKNQASVGAAGKASSALRARNSDYDAAMSAYAANSPQAEITKLLAENKLRAMPNPSSTSLGEDTVRAQIAALMQRIAPTQAPIVSEKLRAADRLSLMRNEPGVEGLQNQMGVSTTGAVTSPLNTLGRVANTRTRIQSNQQLARLLANPTEENIGILQQLAKTDPDAARALRELGHIGAVNAAGQTQGSQP